MIAIDTDIDSPNYIPLTAWLRHGPFAMWLVRTMKPRRIVELGTHYGFSYFSFCQAVASHKLMTDCFAVDTWAGDEHAGYYDDSVYLAVVEENIKFAGFSTLLRKTFAEALDDVEDNSVDILHVDGRHFYDDVKEDFTSWTRKLSDRAVVLFHDTEVRERDFGVWRYWAELTLERPAINFRFEHGLGVLFWGESVPDELQPFVGLIEKEPSRTFIENYFKIAGDAFSEKIRLDEQLDTLRLQLSSELSTSQELRRTNNVLIEELEEKNKELVIAASRLEAVKYILNVERKSPLIGLKSHIAYVVLTRIARISSSTFPKFSERLSRSAAKRDPSRDPFRGVQLRSRTEMLGE
ncbi:class I SAM-dependent methyltransferase [Agrobacterium tumefaciens]|uniref:class I SAM-dependent methyltransferase n=1 Tax=Agrobacterium tumefaciens TaxID=358 RepID=UPI001572459A|nr:class I SAM-dependent methyltransferase [Agrobacterium tumefaciens]NSZ86810.1 class I SAM-dependent methyltransferase [Agrobacterium tumefaciens]WCA71993.1 class I SAM-dependent methyltransferase [Agrobacterium tumefaciens]